MIDMNQIKLAIVVSEFQTRSLFVTKMPIHFRITVSRRPTLSSNRNEERFCTADLGRSRSTELAFHAPTRMRMARASEPIQPMLAPTHHRLAAKRLFFTIFQALHYYSNAINDFQNSEN